MNIKKQAITCFALLIAGAAFSQNRVSVITHAAIKKIDILVNDEPFTSLLYADSLKKPVLYPILGPAKAAVTRGWPLAPKIGDKVDHPHQFGLWFNYGDVNGVDYWNNSRRVDTTKKPYGSIRFKKLLSSKGGQGAGVVSYLAVWVAQGGKATLEETTTYTFSARGSMRIIDRATTLKALTDVTFNDNKEGLYGMRVARQLEHKADKAEKAYLGPGNVVPVLDNMNISGHYLSSEGKEGEEVFGTRARWVRLSGKVNDEAVAMVMMDHVKNVNYPAYWMTRGYGLFAVNPLGAAVYSNGKQTLNFSLKKDQQTTFKYRLVIDEELDKNKIEALYQEFQGK